VKVTIDLDATDGRLVNFIKAMESNLRAAGPIYDWEPGTLARLVTMTRSELERRFYEPPPPRKVPKHDPQYAAAVLSRWSKVDEFHCKAFWAWVFDEGYAPAHMLKALEALKIMGRIVTVRGRASSTVYEVVRKS